MAQVRYIGSPFGTYYSVSGEGHVVGSCECVKELSGFIKCGDFLD
jgi:hypothetical protein